MQLFVNTRGSVVKKQGDRFVIAAKRSQHEFSAKKLSSIVIATAVSVTSDAVLLASENNVEIVFLNSSGDPTSRIWQTRMGSTASIRIAQLKASLDATGLEISREWILAKVRNQIAFLQELKERRPASQQQLSQRIGQLTDNQSRIECVQIGAEISEQEHIDLRASIRGFEGTSGRIYFGALSDLMPAKYQFPARSRRSATDPFNAMLNYSYGVLYSHVEKALILAGVDPFIGFFHANRYGQPSLVFDMIEPFRIIGERTTTLYFTGKRVRDDWFRDIPGGIELAPDGRAALIESLNARLEKTVRYPVQKTPSKPGPAKTRNIKLRDTIRYEAHSVANRLLGKSDIPQVVTSEDLFGDDP